MHVFRLITHLIQSKYIRFEYLHNLLFKSGKNPYYDQVATKSLDQTGQNNDFKLCYYEKVINNNVSPLLLLMHAAQSKMYTAILSASCDSINSHNACLSATDQSSRSLSKGMPLKRNPLTDIPTLP